MQISWETVAAISSVMAVLMSGILWIANRIFKFGETYHRLVTVESDIGDIKKTIATNRSELKHDIIELSRRIDNAIFAKRFTQTSSPRQLTEEGRHILRESGVDKIVRANLASIVEEVKAAQPKNSYQAQELVIEAVNQLLGNEKLRDKIEQGSFDCGQPTNVLLYLGAIYIRDEVLSHLGLISKSNSKKT